MKRAYIIFTREPVAGKTKTRMMPYLTPEECVELHTSFLKDFSSMSRKVDADVFVYYDSEDGKYTTVRECFGDDVTYSRQIGNDIGIKMYNAIRDVLDMGYESCVLTGTDIPELRAESVNYALDTLDECDAVVGRTADGGYHLIGMKKSYIEPFSLKEYQSSSVFDCTVDALRSKNLDVRIVHEYHDMDTPKDLREFRCRVRQAKASVESKGLGSVKNMIPPYTAECVNRLLKVSIVVPIYNESSTILVLQDQLKSYVNDAEIIFVDGGSTDNTLDLIDPAFKVISSDKGRGIQMNAGAEASSGDVILFLHCDSILPDDVVGQIKEVMMTYSYGCFGVNFDSKQFFLWTNKHISNYRAWHRGIPFGDQGIFIDRELFMEIGKFPEIPIMEDYQFSLNLRTKGYMPGKTRDRITSSCRRYGASYFSIMATEYKMWRLRRRYIKGETIDSIAKDYADVR